MAPLAAIDIPQQPFVHGAWSGSHVHFNYSLSCDEDSNCLGVVCRNAPLTAVVEKKIPTPLERKRRVSFSGLVETREIQHLLDMPSEDVFETWWTPNDYMVIRKMMMLTVRLIANGSKFEADDVDFCELGLEMRTRAAAISRHLNRQRAIEAVLRAQDFQRREGFSDPEYIAEIYSEYGDASRQQSLSAGLSQKKAALS